MTQATITSNLSKLINKIDTNALPIPPSGKYRKAIVPLMDYINENGAEVALVLVECAFRRVTTTKKGKRQ